MNTDNKIRGRFAWLVVYVNLDRPLVSQIFIDGKLKRVEYEFLPTVYFHYGKCGRFKESYPSKLFGQKSKENGHSSKKSPNSKTMNVDDLESKSEIFEHWMLVERKSRCKSRDLIPSRAGFKPKKIEGSWFKALANMEMNVGEDLELNSKENYIGRRKGNDILPDNFFWIRSSRKI